MIICTPLRRAENVEELVAAGAGEFYAGIEFPLWQEKYGNLVEMNRRSHAGSKANFENLTELQLAVAKAHRLDRMVYIAINQHQFTANQLPVLRELLEELKHIEIDGVIVADLNLILIAIELGLPVVVSTDAVAANRNCFSLFQRLGVKRIITPRSLTLDEIASLKRSFPGLEMEVFMLNGACKFTDGLCFGLHIEKDGAFCQFFSHANYELIGRQGNPSLVQEYAFTSHFNDYKSFYRRRACGLCACWRLVHAGIERCKLVGRALPVERIKVELKLIGDTIQLAEQCEQEQDFLAAVTPPFEDQSLCAFGYQCYYPEVCRGFHD